MNKKQKQRKKEGMVRRQSTSELFWLGLKLYQIDPHLTGVFFWPMDKIMSL